MLPLVSAHGVGLRTGVPATTMSDRHRVLADLCRSDGVDALLFYGNEAARHDIRFITGWGPGWDTYALIRPGSRPWLWIPAENHVPSARSVASETVDVAWVGPDPVSTIVDATRAIGPGTSFRLGIVGPLPYRTFIRLGEHLPGTEFIDMTAAFTALRLVKGPEEIEAARRAAALADLAIEELRASLRPGKRDYELGAIVEEAYRRRGGEHGICFLASAAMTGGGPIVPAQVWSDRELVDGDLVTIELSVGVDGVTSQILRTIALGVPTPDVLRLHGVADEAFASLLAAALPGTSAARLLEVAGLIDAAGMTVVDDVVHGYGGGYLPPVLRTPRTQRRPVPDLELRPGMMLVVQPNVVTLDGRLGVQTGELVVITERGAERLHALPTGLLRAQ